MKLFQNLRFAETIEVEGMTTSSEEFKYSKS